MSFIKNIAASSPQLRCAALSFSALLLIGCAGGGHSLHIPPEYIEIGQPTSLTFELSSWGYGSGKLSKRYTERRCNYRIVGKSQFISTPMLPVSETPENFIAQCIIPPLQAQPGDYLEYTYEMLFDGVENLNSEDPVPFR